MPEQSHKKDMADALRGDFQRARSRGVASILGAVEEDPTVEDVTAAIRGTATAVVETAATPVERSEAVRAAAPGDASPVAAEPTRRRSLFGRLAGRS